MKKNEISDLKIVYVILHYNALNMTKQCISCIKKICSIDSEIVLVDNCSPNNSGEELRLFYEDDSRIHVIKADENLGFAKGNNLGFEYAKNKLSADIIVDINNDILIEQNDFENIIREIVYTQNEYAVLAPDILNRNGFHQNPLRCTRLKSSYVLGRAIRHFIYLISLKTGIGRKELYSLYHKKDVTSRAIMEDRDVVENIVPHGSCVIFLPQYIHCFDFAFIPITFFYCEEDLLFDLLKCNGMVSLYTNKITVKHMEKISTSTISKSVYDREQFQVRNKTSSLFALLKYRLIHHIL